MTATGQDVAGGGIVPVPISSVTGAAVTVPGEATRNPYLVVTPAVGDDDRWAGWSVTHRPTGLRGGPAVTDVAAARQGDER